MDGTHRSPPAVRAVLAAGSAAVAAVVLGPVLVRRGYVLSYDMVFVPDPPLAARVLGTDGGAPRAVPSDLLVVALARLLPADLVQKLLLVAVLALAVHGAGRLAHRLTGCGPIAALAAGVVYGWSPFLAERLVLGQWALLLGFAALPWAVAGAADVVAGRPGGLARACAWTVPAAAGGGNATALLAPAVAVVLLAAGRRAGRPLAVYAGVVAGLSLPWVLPALLRPGGLPSDPAGVGAFAARADGPLGLLGSLVTLGGIWNGAAVPAARRDVALAVVALVVVLGALAAGLPAVLRHRAGRGLCAAGVLGLLVPAVLATAPGQSVLVALVVHVPGGGLLRDGQKLLAAWVLLVAVAAGAAVEAARVAVAPLRLGATVALAAAVLPVGLLPGLALGASGRLAAVEYPRSWAQARAVLDADPAPGGVVVLPFAPYRRFAWNGPRVVLDPAQRVSARPVVVDDRLPLRTGTVAGEDPRAAAVLGLLGGLADGGTGPGTADLAPALAGLGYRFVLLHRGAPGADVVTARLGGGDLLLRTADLDVYRLPDVSVTGPPTARAGFTPGRARVAVQVGGLTVSGLLAVACLTSPWVAARRRRRRPADASPHGAGDEHDAAPRPDRPAPPDRSGA